MQNTKVKMPAGEGQEMGNPLVFAIAGQDADIMKTVTDALAGGRAQLAYQPIVTADDATHVAFYEGLIRLQDEAGRTIPAGQFMPQIEDNNLGRKIDCTTLELAIQKLQQTPDLRLSVNLSARSIGYGEWRRILDRALLERDSVADRLIFEISETSAMMLHENVMSFMGEMQPKGIAFALDGFGAGLTAFRHLKSFMFDLVKIDKSFIRGIDRDPDNQVLAEVLTTVARQFEMFVVADGVETEAELLFLQTLGVDCMQGYHLGSPSFSL